MHTASHLDDPVVADPDRLIESALADPVGFWERHARTLRWLSPWTQAARIEGSAHAWFVGGTTNATLNALDRHIEDGRGSSPALTWASEDGQDVRNFTYSEVRTEVCQIANALAWLGVSKGDRVVLYMPLIPEAIFTMLACARLGAVHAAVYAGIGETALRDRIADCEPTAVIYADRSYRRGTPIPLTDIVCRALSGLDQPNVIGLRRSDAALPEGHLDFRETVSRAPAWRDAEPMDAEDPLFILYTSGTTGRPKGVVHVHGGYIVGVDWFARNFFELGPDRGVWWSTSDVGWIVGHSYIVYGPFLAGAHQFVREGAADWPAANTLWRLVDQHKVTAMFVAPTLLRMFIRAGESCLEGSSRRTLRLIACAGEPLNPEAMAFAKNRILCDDAGTWGQVVDNFWQTEIASPLIGTFPAMVAKPGFAGRPMPTVRTRIVNPVGARVPVGETGLLVIEQPLPYMLRTIWRDHPRYESLWSKVLGGYVTGDVAVEDGDGYVSLLGRSDDVINSAGHRIATAEIESSLVTHQAVAECAVIGLPDALKGEVIKAFVVLRQGFDGSDGLRRELSDHVRRQLGPIAQPAQLDFSPGLPKTRSGKVMRRVLRARELGQDVGDISTLED